MKRLNVLVAAMSLVGLGMGTAAWADILIVECGSAPYPDIDSAIAVANPGDTILVHECPGGGRYDKFTVGALSNVRILGVDAAAGTVGAVDAGVGSAGVPGVLVEGRGFFSCVFLDGSSDVTIANLRLVNCLHGVLEQNGTRNVLHGLYIEDSLSAGYHSETSVRSVFAGNTLEGSVSEGIRIVNATDPLVFDNVISTPTGEGIELVDNVNSGVQNNQIVNAGGDGIISTDSTDPGIDLNSAAAAGTGIVVDVTTNDGEIVGNETGGPVANGSVTTQTAENL